MSDGAVRAALDADDFRSFVTARGPALMRTAYMLTGDQQLAEDLVQSALEKAARRWRDIRAPAAAESYVRRILYREQVGVWRRRRVAESLPGALPDRAAPVAEDEVENRLVLRAALATLGRRQRTVLVLRFYEDLTERQVADALGVSVGTVKSQTAKALRHLRERCGEPALVSGTRREERS